MRCEDYPCCGHELGCCPSFSEDGRQLDMVCVCGARLPVGHYSSCCEGCLREAFDDPAYGYGYEDEDEDHDEDMLDLLNGEYEDDRAHAYGYPEEQDWD